MKKLITKKQFIISSKKTELNFLDLVYFLYLNKNPVTAISIPFDPKIYSFNTPKELNFIKKL